MTRSTVDVVCLVCVGSAALLLGLVVGAAGAVELVRAACTVAATVAACGVVAVTLAPRTE